MYVSRARVSCRCFAPHSSLDRQPRDRHVRLSASDRRVSRGHHRRTAIRTGSRWGLCSRALSADPTVLVPAHPGPLARMAPPAPVAPGVALPSARSTRRHQVAPGLRIVPPGAAICNPAALKIKDRVALEPNGIQEVEGSTPFGSTLFSGSSGKGCLRRRVGPRPRSVRSVAVTTRPAAVVTTSHPPRSALPQSVTM